jgi:hypothetical protein
MKYSLLLSTLLSGVSFAQTVTMEQANEPAIGNTKTMYVCDSLTEPLANTTGSGVTWDYSNVIGANSTKIIEIIDPATSAYSSAYPTSTKGFSIQGSLTNFYNSTATERVSQGFVFEEPSLGVFVATFETDEQKTVSYPFAYGSVLNDAFAGSLQFSLNGVAQNPTCTGNSYASIDGEGTLLLPSGNAFSNVIRYKIVDTVFTQVSFIIPIDIIFVRTQYEYYDLSNDVLPLFTYTDVKINQSGSSTPLATQTAILSSVQPTAMASVFDITSNEFSIAPNPTTDQFVLKLKGNQTHSLTISDLSGRVVKSIDELTNGQAVSVAGIPSGTYLVKLDHSVHSEKLIIK